MTRPVPLRVLYGAEARGAITQLIGCDEVRVERILGRHGVEVRAHYKGMVLLVDIDLPSQTCVGGVWLSERSARMEAQPAELVLFHLALDLPVVDGVRRLGECGARRYAEVARVGCVWTGERIEAGAALPGIIIPRSPTYDETLRRDLARVGRGRAKRGERKRTSGDTTEEEQDGRGAQAGGQLQPGLGPNTALPGSTGTTSETDVELGGDRPGGGSVDGESSDAAATDDASSGKARQAVRSPRVLLYPRDAVPYSHEELERIHSWRGAPYAEALSKFSYGPLFDLGRARGRLWRPRTVKVYVDGTDRGYDRAETARHSGQNFSRARRTTETWPHADELIDLERCVCGIAASHKGIGPALECAIIAADAIAGRFSDWAFRRLLTELQLARRTLFDGRAPELATAQWLARALVTRGCRAAKPRS